MGMGFVEGEVQMTDEKVVREELRIFPGHCLWSREGHNHSVKGDPFSMRDKERFQFSEACPFMPFHFYTNLPWKGYKDSGNVTYTNLKPCSSVIS